MTTKLQIETKLKSLYTDFNSNVFNEYWKEAHDKKNNIYDVVCKLQPLIIKEKQGNELNFEEGCRYCAYLDSYLSMGGDPEYFISGAGSGDCTIS
jgi:hypothetical protein